MFIFLEGIRILATLEIRIKIKLCMYVYSDYVFM